MRGEGLSGEVDDLVTYIVVTCDDKTSVAADELATHIKGLQAPVKVYLKVRGVNVIMCK